MSYILPIRAARPVTDELLSYLWSLTRLPLVTEVIVVDSSDAAVFANFTARCGDAVSHVRVDSDLQHLANGKVAGVLTGVRLASQPYLMIADEDVRYDEPAIAAVCLALDHADVVRPQNYFDPLPWHACLDTARTLINRATGGDWPGTLGVRRAALERSGGYDGNVLFENLELVRTIRAAGGRELRPLSLFVRRLPPRTGHFWSQRVRQAYDEFARPARLVTWLAIGPALIIMLATMGWTGVAIAMAVPMAVAETGRRRGGGASVFPSVASLFSPLWIVERAVCAWLAVAVRLALGGVPYHGRVLKRAATPYRTLLRKHAAGGGEIHPAPQ